MKHTFDIALDNGTFWQRNTDSAGNVSEEKANFTAYDKLADGFKWSMAVKLAGQRKFHAKGPVTFSVLAMLDYVKAELLLDYKTTVVCLTPDVELTFFVV